MKSSLISYERSLKWNGGKRGARIDTITPHCVVGQHTVEQIWSDLNGNRASANYGIGKDGKIGCYVDETIRAWTSSSTSNDDRAITIECASDTKHPYTMTDAVYDSLVNLCIDICKRYGKNKLLYLGSKDRTLKYQPAYNEMVVTLHKWFKPSKSCPGQWLSDRIPKLVAEVNQKLEGYSPDVPYRVKVAISDLNIRAGAGTNTKVQGICKPGIYTIVEEKQGKGSRTGWGKLKSGAGWVSLDYAHRV